MKMVVMLGVILAGWGWHRNRQNDVFTVVLPPSAAPALSAALQDFEKIAPQPEILERPYDEVYSYERDCLAGKPVCDVIVVDVPWIQEFSTSKAGLLPLEIREEEQFVSTTLDPVRTTCPAPTRQSRHCYAGVPYSGNSEILCYNPRLMPNPPQDWASALEYSHTHPTKGYVVRGTDKSSLTDEFMPMYWALNRNVRDALTLVQLLGMNSPHEFYKFESFDVDAVLLKGAAAMGMVWSDDAMRIARERENSVGLAFAQLPGGKPELGVWYLAVPENAPHREIARRFVAEATNVTALSKAIDLGNPPPRSDLLLNADNQLHNPSFKAQYISLTTATARPPCEKWKKEVEAPIGETIGRLYIGEITPADKADAISQELQKCEARGNQLMVKSKSKP